MQAVNKVARKRVPVKKPSSPKQKAFLAAYAVCGSIRVAAGKAKCSRCMHYVWMQDAAYAEAFAEAHEKACETLEGKARRRALKGVAKPICLCCSHIEQIHRWQWKAMLAAVAGCIGWALAIKEWLR